MSENDTKRAEELIQAHARARAGINLAEGGRGEAVKRRTEAHFGSEDPIACPSLAREGGFRPCFGRFQRERNRSEQIKRAELRFDDRQSVRASEHRLQRRASRGRCGRVMSPLGWSGTVTGRLGLVAAVSTARMAMDEAHRLRRDENQKSERRQRAEQRSQG